MCRKIKDDTKRKSAGGFLKNGAWTSRTAQVLTALMMVMLCTMSCQFPVCAAGNPGEIVSNAFNVIYQIVAAVVSSIGVLVILWGLFEWGQSMNTQDGGAQGMAFKRIGGGLVMAIGPQLLPLITSSIGVAAAG